MTLAPGHTHTSVQSVSNNELLTKTSKPTAEQELACQTRTLLVAQGAFQLGLNLLHLDVACVAPPVATLRHHAPAKGVIRMEPKILHSLATRGGIDLIALPGSFRFPKQTAMGQI